MKWYVLFILVVGLAMVEIVQAQSNQDVKIFNFPGATDTSTDAIGITGFRQPLQKWTFSIRPCPESLKEPVL
jgi:hypothetical protein